MVARAPREHARVLDRIAADVSDHRQAVRRRGVRPCIVNRDPFLAGQRMTLAGRAGDEHRANAIGGQERRLHGDDFRSDAAVRVKRRMNRGDKVVKTKGQRFLQKP